MDECRTGSRGGRSRGSPWAGESPPHRIPWAGAHFVAGAGPLELGRWHCSVSKQPQALLPRLHRPSPARPGLAVGLWKERVGQPCRRVSVLRGAAPFPPTSTVSSSVEHLQEGREGTPAPPDHWAGHHQHPSPSIAPGWSCTPWAAVPQFRDPWRYHPSIMSANWLRQGHK